MKSKNKSAFHPYLQTFENALKLVKLKNEYNKQYEKIAKLFGIGISEKTKKIIEDSFGVK